MIHQEPRIKKRIKAGDLLFSDLFHADIEKGHVLFNKRRAVIFDMEALGTLRQQMIGTIGQELTMGVLTRFGYSHGASDASMLGVDFDWETENDWLAAGPILHTLGGLVHVNPKKMEFNRQTGEFHMHGIWRNSYEAEIHLERFGPSAHPVCWTLTGYASGYATCFFGRDLLAIETECVGKGDDHCYWEIRPVGQWGSEASPYLKALKAIDVVSQLKQFRANEQALKTKAELRRLTQHLQENIEEGRKRIAREIHDKLGQQLSALKNDLAWTESRIPEDSPHLKGKIRSMAELVDSTSSSVYAIIHKLRPLLLDELGLPDAIDWLVSEFRRKTGIACELDAVLDDLALDPDAVTGVFRLLQEMLANVDRHSGAKRCRVRIRRRREEISLLVVDDGRGTRTDRIDNPASFGLLGMRERARALGGRFRIRGIPGKGTIVAVLIPG